MERFGGVGLLAFLEALQAFFLEDALGGIVGEDTIEVEGYPQFVLVVVLEVAMEHAAGWLSEI